MSYTSYEIQDISSEYRNIARRLSRTDYSQCNANLKRFMNVINTNQLISDFISENNTVEYDIAAVIKARDWLDPFEISPVVNEEISFEYQLLTYALNHFDGDFTRLYGTHCYTSTKSTVNDEMHKFINHIIDPLIDHIGEYLRHCYEKAVRDESKDNNPPAGGITANNSTVVIGSTVEGNISTQVTINEDTKNEAVELIASIKDLLNDSDITEKDEVVEILKQIEDALNANHKPKKGFLSALKALCSGSTAVISLVTALIKLLSP